MSYAANSDDAARLAAHHQKMTQTPVAGLVVRLAIPSILSMLVTSIYNMADTYFVSQLNTSASGAVGVVFSMMAVFQACGYMLGTGGGNIIARQLGAKDPEAASRTASTAFFSAIALGLLFAVFGRIFLTGLMRLLGATETILPYARDYGAYILFAAPIMCGAFVMNCLLRHEGKSSLATVGITTGGLLNIALDPLFIYVLKLETAGAAIATALSQCISFLILLFFFLSKKSNMRLGITRIARSPKVFGRIVLTGLPSLNRQGFASISTLLLNRAAMPYGDAAIAAMSIVSRAFMFVYSAIIGFLQGFQPVSAFNYGAKKYERVKKALWFAGTVAFAATVILAVAYFLAAPYIVTAFRRDDQEVIEIGTLALRLQCVILPICSIASIANFSLQSTGQALYASILSSCRQGIFFIPLILILPATRLGLLGVQLTQTISDVCTLAVSLPFLIHFLHMLSRKCQEQEQAAALEEKPEPS